MNFQAAHLQPNILALKDQNKKQKTKRKTNKTILPQHFEFANTFILTPNITMSGWTCLFKKFIFGKE